MVAYISKEGRAFAAWVNWMERHFEWQKQEPKWWHFIAHYKWRKSEPKIEWKE